MSNSSSSSSNPETKVSVLGVYFAEAGHDSTPPWRLLSAKNGYKAYMRDCAIVQIATKEDENDDEGTLKATTTLCEIVIRKKDKPERIYPCLSVCYPDDVSIEHIANFLPAPAVRHVIETIYIPHYKGGLGGPRGPEKLYDLKRHA